jgi:hypothetical protein
LKFLNDRTLDEGTTGAKGRARMPSATSALDRLADALRRAEATWHGGEISAWDELTESDREQWRTMALREAAAVFEEVIESSPDFS